MESYADDLKREISLVDGVARVDLWGVQARRIYLDVHQSRLEQLGISDATIAATLEKQNVVVDGGRMFIGATAMRMRPTGEFRNAQDIRELVLKPGLTDLLQTAERASDSGRDEIYVKTLHRR